MATNKPNKYDVKVRYVKTHAAEIDFPAAKDISPIFVSRLGEYTTTQEVFLPGAVVREIQKGLKNPAMGKTLAGAFKQIAEAVAPIVAQSPTAAGVVAGAAEMMGNIAKNTGKSGPVRTPPPITPDMIGRFVPPVTEPPSEEAPEMPTEVPPPVDATRFRNIGRVAKTKKPKK